LVVTWCRGSLAAAPCPWCERWQLMKEEASSDVSGRGVLALPPPPSLVEERGQRRERNEKTSNERAPLAGIAAGVGADLPPPPLPFTHTRPPSAPTPLHCISQVGHMQGGHGGDYASEQPVDLSYVTKGRGIPRAPLSLSADKLWVSPLPSCASMPPLPRADAVNPEDYLGERGSLCRCRRGWLQEPRGRVCRGAAVVGGRSQAKRGCYPLPVDKW
jgi:hypothetical protein